MSTTGGASPNARRGRLVPQEARGLAIGRVSDSRRVVPTGGDDVLTVERKAACSRNRMMRWRRQAPRMTTREAGPSYVYGQESQRFSAPLIFQP
jgi:hypothetical protein